jgi:pimeloyl-ACP methyl ester carboxylesterase
MRRWWTQLSGLLPQLTSPSQLHFPVRQTMSSVSANGIRLEYESYGSAQHQTILLIMGLGCQLTRWPMALCDELVSRGYRVIRFDNRDVGLSTKMDHTGKLDVASLVMGFMMGKPLPSKYSLEDLAMDTVGLLDALDIQAAHIVGASMGGMIAQILAARHPSRVLSLTSIMSTTSNPALPQARPVVAAASLQNITDSATQAAKIASGVNLWQSIGSPAYPIAPSILREEVSRDAQRAFHPAGVARQMLAIASGEDRRALCAGIVAPTVVLHGADDPLIPVEGGRDTAAAIPGAELRIIPGMGHDIPHELIPVFVDAITRAARRAKKSVT